LTLMVTLFASASAAGEILTSAANPAARGKTTHRMTSSGALRPPAPIASGSCARRVVLQLWARLHDPAMAGIVSVAPGGQPAA
jgi:hypothetical protein